MLTRRTIIGMVVGSAIIAIGAYSLVSDIGFQSISVDETFGVGERTAFRVTSNQGGSQYLAVTGEKFDISIQKPGEDGPSKESYRDGATLEWMHLEDGVTDIVIQNTGSTDMRVTADYEVTTDPILFSYHIIVITSGMVIIGFSVSFTVRKPKGF